MSVWYSGCTDYFLLQNWFEKKESITTKSSIIVL